MKQLIKVGLLGFSNLDTIKLERILLTYAEGLKYRPVVNVVSRPHVDAILVNAEHELAVTRAEQLATGKTKLILVGANFAAAKDGRLFIATPIIGIRLIKLLDELFDPKHQLTPVVELEPPVKPMTANPELSPVDANDKVLAVLIVDDNVLIQKAIAQQFNKLLTPVSLDFANSGEQALEFIANADLIYDLIFLDIVMPGIDGYETCKRIRQDQRYRQKKPIIMLSSKSSAAEQLTGYAAGCTNFLTKPIVTDEFQHMLERVTAWLTAHKHSAYRHSLLKRTLSS